MYQVHIHPQHKHTCTRCTTKHIHTHAPLNIKCTTKYICKVMHHVHMYVQDTHTCTTHAPPIICTTKYRINLTHTCTTYTHVPDAPLNTYTHMYQVHIHPQHKHTCTRCTTKHIHTHAPLNIKCTTKYICKVMHYVHMYVPDTHICTTKYRNIG